MKKVRATNKFLISYVCSLFTSIPLKETINIAVDLLFEHNPNFQITKNEFKKLFDFATSSSHFLFDGIFYDQIDGVAMGSPLDPVLANLFMGYHEANWLQVFKGCEIILYCRYVDDIICLFNSESDCDKFYEFLSKQHPNITCTFEKQQNNQISFLDIPSCNGNHVFMVDHGYPWLFHGHVFIFHIHGQECNHTATKTWLTIVIIMVNHWLTMS